MMNDTSHFWTPQEILPYVGAPYFAPGHGYSYSNTDYLLAGMIIEAATGVNWVQKLHDFIFNPLTMDSTFVGALNPGDTIDVNLPQITAGVGSHQFICYTELPNGAQEGYTFNDTTKSNFIVTALPSVTGDLSESFDGNVFPPAGWALSSSSIYQWGQTPLAHFSGTGSAVRSNYIDSQIGAFYNLDLPIPTLPSAKQ